MAEDEAFAGDHLGAAAAITGAAAATTFSQLLFAADHDHDDDVDKNHYRIFNYSSSSSSAFAIGKPPKMLCFGNKEEPLVFAEPSSIFKSRQRSGLTCSDSSSTSSGNNGGRTKSDSKLKKPNGSDPEAAAAIKATPATNQRTSKKIRADAPGSAGHAKRKEKLGERITALQQLVSPFGKTDTASVLHEAMGYIKFLHEQVQVLCSPYLQNLPSSLSATGERENGEEEAAKSSEVDLRSRGLCLIPVDCSLHLANCTVADFWSPAMAMGRKL